MAVKGKIKNNPFPGIDRELISAIHLALVLEEEIRKQEKIISYRCGVAGRAYIHLAEAPAGVKPNRTRQEEGFNDWECEYDLTDRVYLTWTQDEKPEVQL
jgi:hypothetical protein